MVGLEGIVSVKVRGDPLSDDNSQSGQEFGANEWLVDEMYSQWLLNPESIDKEWQPILERYHQLKQGNQPAAPVTPITSAPVTPITPQAVSTSTGSLPLVAKTTRVEPQAQPIPAQAPTVDSAEVLSLIHI